MQRLVVIRGGYQTGKMPLARKLMAEDETLLLVHRDHFVEALGRSITDGHMTLLQVEMAKFLLANGYSVINCAWNTHPHDLIRWAEMACEFEVKLELFDVTLPEIAALIPPMGD